MADLKRASETVFFGFVAVPAGTVIPADHEYAGHPAFVDYEPTVPAVPPLAEEVYDEDVEDVADEVEEEEYEEEVEEVDERPPSSGAGSGRDNWVAYADSLGVEATDDMTRDDIIAAVDAYEADE